jgi:hypothetical protein
MAGQEPGHLIMATVGRGRSADLDELAFLDRLDGGVRKGESSQAIGA